MTSLLRCAAAAALLLCTGALPAQVLLQETFNNDPVEGCTLTFDSAGSNPFPDGWLLRNVDNRSPDISTAYINEAWEVREDFAEDAGNCAAFSTSYYSPVGAADDWMWTPGVAITSSRTLLRWRARSLDPAFRDSYEVRVMVGTAPTGGTGVLGNQVTNSTVVYSTAAELTTWANYSVSLAAYAGNTVYVAFRNTSNDRFVLLVDDVMVEVPLLVFRDSFE